MQRRGSVRISGRYWRMCGVVLTITRSFSVPLRTCFVMESIGPYTTTCAPYFALCTSVQLHSALCSLDKFRCMVKGCAKVRFHNFIPRSAAVVLCFSQSLEVDYFQSGQSRRSVYGVVFRLASSSSTTYHTVNFASSLPLFLFVIHIRLNIIILAISSAVILIDLVVVTVFVVGMVV